MATQVKDVGDRWEVARVTSPGKTRRIPRKPVYVPLGDIVALREAVTNQALAARADLGIKQAPRRPVD